MESGDDVVKNELAGGVLPSKYFGAIAAWLRLAALAEWIAAYREGLRLLLLPT